MNKSVFIVYFLNILFFVFCCCCCCDFADADTTSCTVICEIPEMYEIPKIKGNENFYLENNTVIFYNTIERK